ncbi:VTC domain-containing protein [Geopyxis carbonaria]|nr:VTC domain-containing protein [Geopyxis carbonaria]
MKYGDALPQRSVLEWLPYNLDYTEVKDLIKRYTISQPLVEAAEQKTDFEDELFEVLADQLGRIDLFVKSKSGEIDRRLTNCKRQVSMLQRREISRPSSKLSNRYARIESDIERAGNDIQSLSRFVNVQRTGFHKLLKKYQKWTGSAHLTARFGILLESPTAFHRQDFETSVLEVSELLAAVRSAINALAEAATAPQIRPFESPVTNTVAKATTVKFRKPTFEDDPQARISQSSFDTSGTRSGGRAVLWVHNDHQIELQVALLKYMTIQTSTPTTTAPSTPALSRRSSSAGVVSGKDDEIASVVFDDLESFSGIQSSATIESVSQSGMRTAGQVWWSHHDPEAHLVVTDNSMPGPGRRSKTLEIALKRKHVETLVDPSSELPIKDNQTPNDHILWDIQNWFRRRPTVVPLAKITCRRTRFTGEIPEGQVSVVIDRDIRMKAVKGVTGWSNPENQDDTGCDTDNQALEFPHAVVEVKWDGIQMPNFVDEIIQSHMVENMPGFALDVHAIALRALDKDIRKTPINGSRQHSRRSSTYFVVSNSSSKNSSTVAGHTSSQTLTPGTSDGAVMEISSLIAARKKKQRKMKTRRTMIESISGEHYWNEFGDGSDDDQEEPYTVLVAPSITGSDDGYTDKSLTDFVVNPITRVFSRFRTVFGDKPRRTDENSPLVDRPEIDDSESSSDDDLVPGGIKHSRYKYGTYSEPLVNHHSVYKAGHLGFFLVSFLVLLITSILALNGSLERRRRHHHRDPGQHLVLDLGVVTGVMVSLVFAVIGITVFLMGRFRASWLHTILIWFMFGVICVGSGAVFALVGRTEVDSGVA